MKNLKGKIKNKIFRWLFADEVITLQVRSVMSPEEMLISYRQPGMMRARLDELMHVLARDILDTGAVNVNSETDTVTWGNEITLKVNLLKFKK